MPFTLTRPAPIHLRASVRDPKPAFERTRSSVLSGRLPGGGFFTPIVNKPEVAILGVGRGALKPVVRGAKIEKRTLLPLGMSYDHRVVDGATAARFIVEVVQALEQFKESEVKI